jgi:predicted RNA-binding protein (virulence factor B family)
MIQIGKVNILTVFRETDVGFFLVDDEKNEVLLPISLVTSPLKLKEKVEVFVYTDSEKQLIASTRAPYAQLNSFAYLRVTTAIEIGAFMDWGLEKDLFVPASEQKFPLEEGEFCVVYIYIDDISNRIVASSKLDRFIKTDDVQLTEGQEVDVLVYEESPLGYSAIINNTYKGLIYHNDIHKEVFIGDELKGYVKTIRPDNLIDLSFQKSGFKNVLDSTEVILEYIKKNNGFISLHDKSTPEEISIKLSMSKATFKKSIGILYRHRKVVIKPDGVYLAVETETAEEPKTNL